MRNSYLIKNRFASILFTVLIALQISACSTEENLVATTAYIDSDTNTRTDSANETNTTANINLSWVAPAEREDNTPISLSEIAGYKIYYGSTLGQYSNSVTINDGSATGHTFQNFTAETYYFVVTTLDTEGRESQFSTEITIAT